MENESNNFVRKLLSSFFSNGGLDWGNYNDSFSDTAKFENFFRISTYTYAIPIFFLEKPGPNARILYLEPFLREKFLNHRLQLLLIACGVLRMTAQRESFQIAGNGFWIQI